MIVKNFLAEKVHKKFLNELNSYEWDSKYFCTRRKKVLNKHARTNVCYGENYRAPDYENKKGTIIGYDQSPLVLRLKQCVESLMKDKDLIVEGNKYLDVKKNGIGAHGDTERVMVACLRVGEGMPMKYGWFHKCKVVGKTLTVNVPGGSLYFMSEKAVGADWKSNSKYTLRHAAGSKKYISLKKWEDKREAYEERLKKKKLKKEEKKKKKKLENDKKNDKKEENLEKEKIKLKEELEE